MSRGICSVEGCTELHWALSYCRRHYRRWKKNGTVELLTPDDRFWAQVDRRGPDECWPWQGATIRGYGHSHANYVHYYAHRRSYEMHHGPIPEGMVVRHRCDNPPCVNPAHLQVGTQVDNINDMIDRGRAHWQNRGGAA